MKYDSITRTSRSRVRSALLEYYDRAARSLPWREETDPYRVLVSEFMLQQTRVDTVRGYYGPWLERFPSVDALAGADDDEVLKAWEGLGYYRRARNLHRAARVVREQYAGLIPGTYDALRALPGVGEYTAGAVASIAFGQRVPAVDGNVRRVLARLFDVSKPKPAWLRERAAELVDDRRPGDWNQALMELGATVCKPRGPNCARCPVSTWCAARAAGTQEERPSTPTRREVPTATIVLAVLHAEGRVFLAKRPPEGLLAGMWAFPEQRMQGPPSGGDSPRGQAGRDPTAPTPTDLALGLAGTLGLEPVGEAEPLPECRHRFTHLEAVYIPWSIRVDGEPNGRASERATRAWVDPTDTGGLALPVAQRKILESWSHSRMAEPV